MLRVRQIYYKEIQKVIGMRHTYGFTPYFNGNSDEFLESSVIRRLYEDDDYVGVDYYGVVSHKFYQKLNKTSSYVKGFIEDDNDRPDVYSFFKGNNKVNLVKQGDNWHPLFSDIYKLIASKLDWSIDFNDNHLMEPIYSNHWIASVDTFKEFCLDFLIPVTNLMNERGLLRNLCFQDANYISNQKISPEICLKVFGKPYYTYHSFILERLFPIFCYLRNKTVKHI